MYTVEMFIGSNNETHVLELESLKQILNQRHDGYTLQVVTGAWRGSEEATARVLVSDQRGRILATIKRIKRKLHQDAIAYHEVTELRFA